MDTAFRKPNRLSNERSPYLLQHAHNPVDWFPWGAEAFVKARKEDKPVFLSIGYSACHWCHVMGEESFADPEVARILNDHFISIKVDREERPDIDNVYLAVCTAFTGQAGWPLTIIMTPDQKPFFAGTYFPKNARYGRPGLLQILRKTAERWRSDRNDLLTLAENVAHVVREEAEQLPPAEDNLSWNTLDRAYKQLDAAFDEHHGGFGREPKFPTPSNFYFLLRYYRVTGQQRALLLVEKTLTAMRRGGIFDQIGLGFHRYSTDSRWLVPHFEKMLYDNALLVLAYLEAYQVTGKEFYARVAREVLTYLLRDMRAPDGGFAAAQDAGAAGKEGAFYTWTPSEVRRTLGKEAGDLFCHYYGVTSEGNFEGHRSIPNLLRPEAGELLQAGGSGKGRMAAVAGDLEVAREHLLAVRGKREHLMRDDKVLTAWNGLAVAALARAGRVLDHTPYLDAAAGTADFLLRTLRRSDGRLLARYREGEAAFPAYLDDYAFLVWGLLELWEATFAVSYLEAACRLMVEQIDLFWDRDRGGFFFTGRDGEELLLRSKEIHDGAMPSGNSVAALNLLRLSRLTGAEDWSKTADAIFRAFGDQVSAHPSGAVFLLMAWQLAVTPPTEVVIAGPGESASTRQLWNVVRSTFIPEAVLLRSPGGEASKAIAALVPAVANKEPRDGQAVAYVCQNMECLEPVADAAALQRLLGEG